MILDTEIFKEVVSAIGIETSLSIITMFQEQAAILFSGAKANSNSNVDRADSLHALKGMANQLGLTKLGHACMLAHDSILNTENDSIIAERIGDVENLLGASINALILEKNRL